MDIVKSAKQRGVENLEKLAQTPTAARILNAPNQAELLHLRVYA